MFRGSDEVMYERNSVDMCLNLADHTVINNRLARSKETNGNCILYHLRHPGIGKDVDN